MNSPSNQKLSLAPMLSVRASARAVEFYKTAFGAGELFRFDAEDGTVIAQLSVGDSNFWVTEESPENLNFSPDSLGGSTARMVLIAEDPDSVFDRAVTAGSRLVWPVADQSYGWRIGRLVDPFGHHWEIGKPL